MPAYNFQRQFEDAIKDGVKKNTIRLRRKRPTKKGDLLRLYIGMRTKKCRLIKETTCLDVVPVMILYDVKAVMLHGEVLSEEELTEFAAKDGFDSLDDFFAFFLMYSHYDRLNSLEVIYWR